MNHIITRKLNTLVAATSIAILILTSPSHAQDVTMQDVVHAADAGDFKTAIQTLETIAAEGDAQAEGFLAYVLSIGEWHVPVDKARAEKLFRSAADKGDGYANLELHFMNAPEADIQPGDVFLPSDDYLANLKTAADAGNAMAQSLSAFNFRNEKKFDESYARFKESAENGSIIAKSMQVFIEDIEHFSPTKNPKRLLEFSSTGFPLINANLAFFYRTGQGVEYAPDLALMYVKVTNLFLNRKSSEDSLRYEKGLSEQIRQEAAARAKGLMFRWATGPNTYLAKAARWCKAEGYWDQSCIINALIAHELCMAPYMSHGFENAQNYPGYSKCRYEASMHPIY